GVLTGAHVRVRAAEHPRAGAVLAAVRALVRGDVLDACDRARLRRRDVDFEIAYVDDHFSPPPAFGAALGVGRAFAASARIGLCSLAALSSSAASCSLVVPSPTRKRMSAASARSSFSLRLAIGRGSRYARWMRRCRGTITSFLGIVPPTKRARPVLLLLVFGWCRVHHLQNLADSVCELA